MVNWRVQTLFRRLSTHFIHDESTTSQAIQCQICSTTCVSRLSNFARFELLASSIETWICNWLGVKSSVGITDNLLQSIGLGGGVGKQWTSAGFVTGHYAHIDGLARALLGRQTPSCTGVQGQVRHTKYICTAHIFINPRRGSAANQLVAGATLFIVVNRIGSDC